MYRSRWSVAGAGGLFVGGVSVDDEIGDGDSELGGGVSSDVPFPRDAGAGWVISRLRVELTEFFVEPLCSSQVLQSAPCYITVR
jgi:hypothetical protein